MNNEITLTDLFEVEMLQRLQDSFSKMTGFAANTPGIHRSAACDASSVTNTAQSSPSRWDPP